MKTRLKDKKPRRSGRAKANGAVAKHRPAKGRVLARKELGQYVVADQAICHGKPTFKGTRVMVHQVLERVAAGEAWDRIIWQYHHSITLEGIAEAVRLASEAFLRHDRLPCPEPV